MVGRHLRKQHGRHMQFCCGRQVRTLGRPMWWRPSIRGYGCVLQTAPSRWRHSRLTPATRLLLMLRLRRRCILMVGMACQPVRENWSTSCSRSRPSNWRSSRPKSSSTTGRCATNAAARGRLNGNRSAVLRFRSSFISRPVLDHWWHQDSTLKTKI